VLSGAMAFCCLLGASCFLSPMQPRAPPQAQTDVSQQISFLGRSGEAAGAQWSSAGILMGAGACVVLASALGTRRRAPATAMQKVTAVAAYDASKELGVCDPLLFWDPIGFCAGDCTKEDFDRRRAVELKHGRLCMMACIGMLWTDVFGKFDGYLSPSLDIKFEDVPSGIAAVSKVPWQGWSQIFLFVGLIETQLFKDQALGGFGFGKYGGTDGKEPGNFGWGYPWGAGSIKDPEVRKTKLLGELNNGRLAMVAFSGLVAQNGVTGQSVIDQLTSGHISPFNDGQGLFAFSGPYALALPWAPVAQGLTNNPLDDKYIGDVGFDPLGFAKNQKLLPWYREAELAHGRACMLATLGISVQVAGGKWEPFLTKYPVDSKDCLGAIGQVPLVGWLQILIFIGTFEIWRYRNVVTQYDKGVAPGDCGWNTAAPTASKTRPKWGGPTFTAKYSKAEFDQLRLKEIKHCRLAMVGFLGMVVENAATGQAPTIFPADLAGTTPDFAQIVGDFYTRQTPYAPPPM